MVSCRRIALGELRVEQARSLEIAPGHNGRLARCFTGRGSAVRSEDKRVYAASIPASGGHEPPTMQRLIQLFRDLPLRRNIVLALVAGLALPIAVSMLITLTERREELFDGLVRDHERIVEVLALGMRTPLWELRPESGAPVIEAIMLDKRITAVQVSLPNQPFLSATEPERRQGEILTREQTVRFAGEEIGRVKVEMDSGHLEALIREQWRDVVTIGLSQFAIGMLVILALLRYKVIVPLRRLVGQANSLAGGRLDDPLNWQRKDEIGVLGRSFESMRLSLRTLVQDLESRNQDLAAREAERREAQRRAEESRSMLEAAIDAVPALVHVKDRQLRYQIINRQFVECWGLSREQFLGKTSAEVFPQSVSRGVMSRDQQVVDSGETLPFEEITHDGGPLGVHTVWSTKVPLLDKDQKVTHILTVELDVAQLVKAEQERRRWTQLLDDAIQSIPNGFAVYDASRHLVVCNLAFASLYRETPEALVGLSAAEIQRRAVPLLRNDHQMRLAEQMVDDGYWIERSEPLEVQLQDGRWLLINQHPTSEGGMVLVRTDITARKRMEHVLRESEKLTALGGLLAGVAHELNNPLSVVVGRAIMLEEKLGDSAAGQSIAKIRAAAERCARIVKTFLAMARKQEGARVPVALAEVIDSALELMGYRLQESDVEVVLDIDTGLPEVVGDPDQLTQVFTNLFINAQQAMQAVDGVRRLTVDAHFDRELNAVCVAVSDTGTGIPDDVRPRIFEPFFTTKEIGQGTGLGLSVSHGIVQAHGGMIDAEQGPGGGTVISVVLPVGDRQAPGQPQSIDKHEDQEAGRILIVDDAADIAEMLREILDGLGRRIEIAENGRSALEKLAAHEFDLIFCDIRMPDIDGPGLYAEIETHRPELLERMVFVTGDALSEIAENFLKRTQMPVVEKPFIPDEIRALAAEMLSRRSSSWRV